jgi:hypothetical protein
MFKSMLFIGLVLFGTSVMGQEPNVELPKAELEPPTVEEFLKDLQKEKEEAFVVEITTSAKETFNLEIKATNEFTAAKQILGAEGEYIVYITPNLIFTFINKSQITSVKVIKKSAVVKPEVKKDLTA